MERHQEHRIEIDARATAFNAFDSFGGQLLMKQHFSCIDIEEKLQSIKKDREAVEK